MLFPAAHDTGLAAALMLVHNPPMPIFEYGCRSCGREFESLVRSDTVPACPGCRSTDLEKKLSVFATAGSGPEAEPVAAGACTTCGHPNGPGSCALN